MRRLILLTWFMLVSVLAGSVYAQTATPTTTPEPEESPVARVTVIAESVFIRAAPDRDSALMSSVFLDDVLIVYGRNSDATWFEVRRPGRSTGLGWIERRWIRGEFAPELIPLTDTSVFGADFVDTGIAAFMRQEAYLREAPTATAESVGLVAVNTVVVVMERNEDATWLRVNYNGTVGWVVGFVTRPTENVFDAPLAANLPPRPPQLIIPPEIQQAQLDRFRAYVQASHDVSEGLAGLWYAVDQGETMPCEPPEFVTDYLYANQDVQELPELDRIAPRFNEGIGYLNAAIDAIDCGIVTSQTARNARNDAINARVIFAATLDRLLQVEELIGD